MNKVMSPRECKEHLEELGALVVVPTYNNAGTIGTLMAGLIKYASDILVVDDGCTDVTGEILSTFGFRKLHDTGIRMKGAGREFRSVSGQVPEQAVLSGRTVLKHPSNMGKGRALKDALVLASATGWKYVVTIDADGQHFPSDIPAFVDALLAGPDSLYVGSRNLRSENMPRRNTFANRFSNFWYRVETGIRLDDTQCGFRVYPLGRADYSGWYYTSLYEFELEAIVYAAWSGTEVRNVPVNIHYPPEGERVSHFRPVRDFTRISLLNTVLVLVCLFYVWPRNLCRKLSWRKIRKFFDDNLFHVRDSNLKLTLSFWLGIFIGLLPFGGYHFVTAVFLAHVLKLNTLVAGAFTLISIAPMMPFIIFCSCWTGSLLLGHPIPFSGFVMSFEDVGNMLADYIIGGIVFAAAASSLCAGICAVLLSVLRRRR